MNKTVLLLCAFAMLSIARENPFFTLEEPREVPERSEKPKAAHPTESNASAIPVVEVPAEKRVSPVRKKKQKREIANFEFVRFVIDEGRMQLETKDRLLKHFALPAQNAIVMDFAQNADFATKRRSFVTKPFKELRIGVHEGFYRVVVELDAFRPYRISKGRYGYVLSLDQNDAAR